MPRSSATPARKLRILVIGAHPDDDEIKAGGSAALWAAAGHTVRFVTATNGGTGHHAIGGVELVRRRLAEAKAAAAVIGIESQVMEFTNGELEPTLYYRKQFIKIIREFNPDLILTHRPNDYHPDHRYTSQLVQDSSYVITVPNNLPTTPALRKMPVIAYLSDNFTKPIPFQPDVVVGIDSVIEKKLDMLHCHVSQFYEWIPWNQQKEDQVPKGNRERRAWLRGQRMQADESCAKKYRAKLLELYGRKAGAKFRYAEAFEICEYGSPLPKERIPELFPFFG
ncbi:MAG: PIG-L family deacetylase [Planctomycetota bacterium]|nr:PIG-L family deacetylase [Planctomycetota bacterium]